MHKNLLFSSAGLCGLLVTMHAAPAQARACPSACAWYQPDCFAQAATCAAGTETCRTAAVSASVQVALANGPGQPLTPYQKARLYPYFGDLVDRVNVHYGALLAGEMFVGGGERLSWGYSAQAFGHDIYLVAPLDEGWDRQLHTLAHELTHVWQYERDQASGGDFYWSYCRAWVEGGYSYEHNAYEQGARDYTSVVASGLANQTVATP
jgi:hypothetical protein